MGAVENLSLGPGKLFVAEVGSTEPVDVTAAWHADWKEVGYTAEGTEVSIDVTREPVTVAEVHGAVAHATTDVSTTVSFAMAEITARNLSIALNGGTITTGTGVVTYDPPEPGDERYLALGWEAEDGTERWVFRKASHTGAIAIGRRKGADKATIPVTMRCVTPTGETPYTVILDDARAGGTI